MLNLRPATDGLARLLVDVRDDQLGAPTPCRDVRIVQLDPATLAALADGDLGRAASTSPIPLSDWLASPECRRTWRMRALQVVERPRDADWITGVVRDDVRALSVGRAGFHGSPDETGTVEVGYAIDPAHRRRGYARAALGVLVARAGADPAVLAVRASVAPSNAASLALVAEFGFVRVGERWDDEDGVEIVFERPAS